MLIYCLLRQNSTKKYCLLQQRNYFYNKCCINVKSKDHKTKYDYKVIIALKYDNCN